nr:unnamed protein product [Spirometra erinaceieuropaei]
MSRPRHNFCVSPQPFDVKKHNEESDGDDYRTLKSPPTKTTNHTREFRHCFSTDSFKSVESFRLRLGQFERAFGANFVIHSSTRLPVLYRCSYKTYIPGGQVNGRERRFDPFMVRFFRTRHIDCPASILLRLRDNKLRIVKLNMEHNHLIKERIDPYLSKLSQEQETFAKEMLEIRADPLLLVDCMNQRFEIDLSLEDIRYLMTPKEVDGFKHIRGGFIEKLRENGFARYILNATGHYQFVSFTSPSLQQFYSGHPEVLSMGYAPNFTACGYLLLIVVGVDKYLLSQPIYFAFINDESLESLRLAVRGFKKLMPADAISQTVTITVDKPGDLATVITEELSHVTPIFCQWYLMQSVKAKLLVVPKRLRSYISGLFTHLMNAATEQDYQHSKEVLQVYSPEFYDYFLTHWDSCTPSWANFQLSRRLTFGSKTNNRIRAMVSSYRQILDSLDTADGLANNLLEHSHQKSQSRARDDLSTVICTRVWRDQSSEVNDMLRHLSPAVVERTKSGVTRRARFSLHPSTPRAPTALMRQRTQIPGAEPNAEAPSFYSSSIQLSVTPVVIGASGVTEDQETSRVHPRVTFQTTGETKYVPLPVACSRSRLESSRKLARGEVVKTDLQCLCSPVLIDRPSRPVMSSPPPPPTEQTRLLPSPRRLQLSHLQQDGCNSENQMATSTETDGRGSESKKDERTRFLTSIATPHSGDTFSEITSPLLQKDRLDCLTQLKDVEFQDGLMKGNRTQKSARQGGCGSPSRVHKRVCLEYEKFGNKEGEEESDRDDKYQVAGSVARRIYDNFGDDSTFFDSSILWSWEHDLGERSSDEDTLDVLRVMKEVESSFRMEESVNLTSEEPTREASCEKSRTQTSYAAEGNSGTLKLASSNENPARSPSFLSDSRKIVQFEEEPLADQQVEVLTVPSYWRIYAETYRRERHRRGVESNPSICVSVLVHQLPIAVVLKSFEDPMLNTKSVQTYTVPTSYSTSAWKKINELGTLREARFCQSEVPAGCSRRLCRYHRYLARLHEANCSTGGLSRSQSVTSCRLTHGGRSHRCSKRPCSDENPQRSLSMPNLHPTSDLSKLSEQEYIDYALVYKLWREINSSLKELQQLAVSPRGADAGTTTSPAVRSACSSERGSSTLREEEPESVELLETSLQISSPKEFSEICLSPIPKTRAVDNSRQRIAELRELIAKRSSLRHQLKSQATESPYWERREGPRGQQDVSRGGVGEFPLKRGTRSLSHGIAKPKAGNSTVNNVECDFEHLPHKRCNSYISAFSGRNGGDVRKYSGSALPRTKCTKSYGSHAYHKHRSCDGGCQRNLMVRPGIGMERNSGGPLTSTLSVTNTAHSSVFWGDSTETESSSDDSSRPGSSVNLPASSPPRHMFFHRLPSPTASIKGFTPRGTARIKLRPSSAEEKKVNKGTPFLPSRPAAVGDSGSVPCSFGDRRSKSWDRESESMRNIEWEDLINEIYAVKTSSGSRHGSHRAIFQLTPSSQRVLRTPLPKSRSSLASQSGKIKPALRDNLLRHTFASLQKVRERKDDVQTNLRKPWVKY